MTRSFTDRGDVADSARSGLALLCKCYELGSKMMSAFSRILLCYDATREGCRALCQGAALAQQLNAETHLLAVLDDWTLMQGPTIASAVPFDLETQSAKEIVREGVDRLAALGVVATGHFAIGNPMDQIPRFAEALKVDLIVVGHRRSHLLTRWWSGQDDGRLLDRVSCSVLVAMETGNPVAEEHAVEERRARRDDMEKIAH